MLKLFEFIRTLAVVFTCMLLVLVGIYTAKKIYGIENTLIELINEKESNNSSSTTTNSSNLNTFTKTDFNCLVEAVYFEGRGEPVLGQLAIAQVVLNRVALPSFPKTICGVVHHKVDKTCAFSYYCDGRTDKMDNETSKQQAIMVASLAFEGVQIKTLSNSTHFHAAYTTPKWIKDRKFVKQIGEHLFYE